MNAHGLLLNNYGLLLNNFGRDTYGPQDTRYILPAGVAVTVAEGRPLTGVTLATFTDAHNAASRVTQASDYLASVSWGDGVFSSLGVSVGPDPDPNDPYGFVVTATSPGPIADPDELIVPLIQYAPGSAFQGRPASLGDPIVAIKPASPINLTATPGAGVMDLQWANFSGIADGFIVKRSDDGVSFPTTVATIPDPGTTTYVDASVSPGHHYWYVVQAYASEATAGDVASDPSQAADAWTPPDVPQGLLASGVSSTEIDLTWAASTAPGVIGYNVYRGTSYGFAPTPLDLIGFGSAATSFQDTALDSDATYFYLVTAITANSESAPSGQVSATTLPAQLAVTTIPFAATEGQDDRVTVASFTDTEAQPDASEYSASVQWGDGSSGYGTIGVNESGGFDVTGDHAYVGAGPNPVTVTVTHTATGRTASATGQVMIADAPILSDGKTVTGIQGQALAGVAVATFHDDNPSASVGGFSATVNWGDGTPTVAGEVASSEDGGFKVLGTHMYATQGDFPIAVHLYDAGGSTDVANSDAQISPPPQTDGGAIISNGTLQLGVNDIGDLNFHGVGLKYLPTGADGTALGDPAEGWGAADATSQVSGYANVGTGNSSNLNVVSFTSTDSTATSVVDVGSTLRVTHDYRPAPDANMYQVSVSIQNVSGSPVDLRYRRVVDWDVQPSAYNEFVTLQGSSGSLAYSNDDGFATADPLGPRTSGAIPGPYFRTGTFDTVGWADLGALMDLGFGALAPHAVQTFTLYYGAGPSRGAVTSSLSAGGVEAYSLAQPREDVRDNDDDDFNAANGTSTAGPADDDGDADDQPADGPNVFACGYKSGPQVSADLQVDSNNDGAVDYQDDAIKADPSKPGKVIVADTLDEEGFGVPGYADFGSEAALAQVNLQLSDTIDPGKATVTFHYSAADPVLVQHAAVNGTTLPQYDPGSANYLRLWDTNTGVSNPRSVAKGGDFIPDNVSMPASLLFKNGQHNVTLFAEGVNPSDPALVPVSVDIDPDGTGAHVIHDTINFTVASLQLVYTDVSGVTHAAADGSILAVPRISPFLQPDGVACDWLGGVDDGSTLLIRAVGSQALANLQGDSTSGFAIAFGEGPQDVRDFALSPNDGEYHGILDGNFVQDGSGKLDDLGLAGVGQPYAGIGDGSLTVLGDTFYRPPNEFNLAQGAGDTRTERRVPIALKLTMHAATLAQGGKPQGLLLTRPPLVLVHGINSGPGVWMDKSGGTAFVDAMTGYEGTSHFLVDHSVADPQRPAEGRTFGCGEISDMYVFVRDMTGTATQAFRDGGYFSTNPYGSGLGGALIAVQKVDVVAHSYGGLLTRWYMEQSGDFESRRDIRKLVTLGTPDKGSPLANMVDEIYRNPTIGGAQAYISPVLDLPTFPLPDQSESRPTLSGLLGMMQASGQLVTTAAGSSTPLPFYEDCSVGSAPLTQLAANPFNSDVAYGAVSGNDHDFIINFPLTHIPTFAVDLYRAIQPVQGGEELFPWIYTIDGAQNTDGIVPAWSSSLGIPTYNHSVFVNHIHLVQSAEAQSTALKWLNDPNLPLGSVQRAAYDPSLSVSDTNEYDGAKTRNPTSNVLSGGGLNSNAIVDVSFQGTANNTVTWDTAPENVGIKNPVLTGMIRFGDIGNVDFQIASSDLHKLNDLGNLTQASLNLDPTRIAGVQANDWVAFRVTVGRMGRRREQILTGPDGQSGTSELQGVRYLMADLPGGVSPTTFIHLPEYTLPAPTVAGRDDRGITLALTGSVECADQTPENPQYASPRISASRRFFDDYLGSVGAPVPHPDGVWNDVLLPYAGQISLVFQGNGFLGDGGSTPGPTADVYQYMESYGILFISTIGRSPTVTISGR